MNSLITTNNHSKEDKNFFYFVGKKRLYGYAKYQNLGNNIGLIEWFVAPRHGRICFEKLMKHRDKQFSLLKLYVSRKESRKVYRVRKYLYKNNGFFSVEKTVNGTVMHRIKK